MKPVLSFIALGILCSAALFLAMSCATPTTRVQPKKELLSRTIAAAAQPKSLWLTWSNEQTWIVNVVDYKTNLSEPWRFYCYVTNAYTNTVWVRLDNTNRECYFRVGAVGFW